MDLQPDQCNALGSYLSRFADLCGDRCPRYTLGQAVEGILGGQSLRCAQIARSAPGLAATDSSEQRLRDMITGHTTKNSPHLDEQHIVHRLVQRGVEMFSADDEIWIPLDTSDLRKPYATKMPNLMQVRDLDNKLVPGYRLITALGRGQNARGLLYHHVFTSETGPTSSVRPPKLSRPSLQPVLLSSPSMRLSPS